MLKSASVQIRECFQRNWFKIDDLKKQITDPTTPFEKLHFPVLKAYNLLKQHKTSGKYKVIVGTLDAALKKVEESPEFKEWEAASEEKKIQMADEKQKDLVNVTTDANGGQVSIVNENSAKPNIEYIDEKPVTIIKTPEEIAGEDNVKRVKAMAKRKITVKKK